MSEDLPEYRIIKNITKLYPSGGGAKIIDYHRSYAVKLGQTKVLKPRESEEIMEIYQNLNRQRAARRAKTQIKDLVRSNTFELFCTFTFSGTPMQRSNVALCKTRMRTWITNIRRKYGKFGYIIVPEFHKDGKSLHFHALLSGFEGDLIDSGVKQSGRPVFNIPSFRYGFTTATKLSESPEDRLKAANYIAKYITKDMPTFSGKKRYWVSQGLLRPEFLYNIFDKRYIVRR